MHKKRWLSVLLFVLLFSCASKPTESIVDGTDDQNQSSRIPFVEVPDFPLLHREKIEKVRSSLTGKSVVDYVGQPFMVLLENSRYARPHRGIAAADIVVEAMVEGNVVSRLLALYDTQIPEQIGPVRSARVPLIQVGMEWKLSLVHFGSAKTGLGDAYSLILKTRWPMRFDGVSGVNKSYLQRDPSKSSPHNVYFHAQEALSVLPKVNISDHLLFTTKPLLLAEKVENIVIDYSRINRVEYKYDANSGQYARFINDEAMMDEYYHQQVSATNIIIIKTKVRKVESVGYLLFDLVGSGPVDIYRSGAVISGTWVRKSLSDVTSYYDSKGQLIPLSVGNTWIQIVSFQVKIMTR